MNLRDNIKRILRENDYSPAGKEVIPNTIVVHKSNPMFREEILKNGLKVKTGECYKIYVGYGTKCKPTIFATNSTNKRAWFDSTYDDDIWEINTEMIPDVKWYKDRHFEDRSKHIVTFQDIPRDAITLKYEGSGRDSGMLEESIKRILREETEYVNDVRVKISDILRTNRDGQSLDDAINNVQDGLKSYSEGPPFLLKIGDKYEVLDGFHRIAQKILDGKKYIISDVMIKESNMKLQESIRRILREETDLYRVRFEGGREDDRFMMEQTNLRDKIKRILREDIKKPRKSEIFQKIVDLQIKEMKRICATQSPEQDEEIISFSACDYLFDYEPKVKVTIVDTFNGVLRILVVVEFHSVRSHEDEEYFIHELQYYVREFVGDEKLMIQVEDVINRNTNRQW